MSLLTCKHTCHGQGATGRAMPCSAWMTLGSRQTYKWALTVEFPRQGRPTHCDQRCSCSPTSPKCCSRGCLNHNFHAQCSQAACSAILVQKADSMLASIAQAFMNSRLPARFVPLTKGGQFRLPIRKISKPSSRADGTRLAALHRSSNMPRCITSLRRDSAVQQRLRALMSAVNSQCKQVGCAAGPASADTGLQQHLLMQVIAAVI